MSSEPVISAQGLGKCYQLFPSPSHRLLWTARTRLSRMLGIDPERLREFWALRNISFDVMPGEMVGIVGRNGSGKSTLLQLVCGTLAPTSGSCNVRGRIAALLELGSGFNPEFSGRENALLNAALLGLGARECRDRLPSIIEFSEIGDFIDQPVRSYSSGMMMRLAFAVQTALVPDLLVVDEALAVGDESFQRKCFRRIEQLRAGGTAVLFVSHSAATVSELCDRCLFLHEGRRVRFGPTSEVIRAYQQVTHAPASEQARLAAEHAAIDTSGSVESAPLQSGPASVRSSVQQERLDEGLVSRTAVWTPSDGATIDSVHIEVAPGVPANVLVFGSEVSVVLKGEIAAGLEGVAFGFHVRTASGVVLGGGRSPWIDGFHQVACSGGRFSVRFPFKVLLTEGVYFIGAGVWGSRHAHCAHRVLDAVAFRVLPSERGSSFGFFELSHGDAIVELA